MSLPLMILLVLGILLLVGLAIWTGTLADMLVAIITGILEAFTED